MTSLTAEPFGPAYNIAGAGLDKFRRMSRRGGVAALERADRQAYGAAVEKAIQAKQRSELQRELPGHEPNCASGTWHTTGADIERAIQQQHRARLQAIAAADRRNREPVEWERLYKQAMEEKRKRMLLTIKETESDCNPRAAESSTVRTKNGAAMNRSKIYPVKSNAARAAAQYGLNRGHLFEISNTETGEKGWAFGIPANVTPIPQRKAAKGTKPAVPSKPPAVTETRASAPAKPKAKPAKASTPAKAPKRKPGAKVGKTAEFIGECKRGWLSADTAMERYGWESNTLRGVLGNYKIAQRKAGTPIEFERKRVDGETFYRIVSAKKSAAA